MTDPADQDMQPDEIPEPPRPYTAKAKARATREPSVRFCWIVTVLIALSCVYATYTGFTGWWEQARVVNEGVKVEAIGFGEGAKITGRPLAIGAQIEVTYTYKGKEYKERGALIATGKKYMAGEPFEIKVDPENPSRWTNREEPVGFRENMVASILLGFFAVSALLAGLVLRQMYLWLWRRGEVVNARVLEHKQSSLAPKSVAVVCGVRHGREERPVTVYLPQEHGVPEVGEKIDLIANASCTRAIALESYHD